jgi:adenosylcobinamide-GDP ribazoletransferase
VPDPRAAVDSFLRHYLLAVQHYTRVPVKGSLASWVGSTPEMLRASTPHLPGVGWLVGMAACVVFALVSVLLPDVANAPLAAAAASTIATALLTGAAHEEALARFADAARSPGSDTRAGTVALVLVVGFKLAIVATLAARSPGAVLTAILAAHTVSRFWPLVLLQTLPPGNGLPELAPATASAGVQRRAILPAVAWCIVPLALMVLAHRLAFMLLAFVVSGLALGAFRLWLRRRSPIGADVLGTAQQVCEAAFYLGAALGIPGR